MTAQERFRAFSNFHKTLDVSDSIDLEYACYVTTETNESPYQRSVLRCLYNLHQSDIFIKTLQSHGALVAISRPDSDLFPVDADVAMMKDSERELQLYRSLLHDLSKNDISLSQHAGIKCARCKSTEIFYEFKQIRSADEGTTVFCVCDHCSKRWKLG